MDPMFVIVRDNMMVLIIIINCAASCVCVCWIQVVLLRRVTLIIIVVFGPAKRDDLYAMLTLTNIVILLIHVRATPYREHRENILETLFLGWLTIETILVGTTNEQFTFEESVVLAFFIYVPTVVGGIWIFSKKGFQGFKVWCNCWKRQSTDTEAEVELNQVEANVDKKLFLRCDSNLECEITEDREENESVKGWSKRRKKEFHKRTYGSNTSGSR